MSTSEKRRPEAGTGGEGQFAALGNCVRFISGGTPSKAQLDYWGGNVPWITAKDMKTFWIEASEDRLTPEGAAAATWLAPPRSTLLLVRGMTLHNDIPIVRIRRESAFNQDVKAVVPIGPAIPEFIPYLLLGHKTDLLNRVDSAGHGTGRLSMEVLSTLPVWLPSKIEQEAIVDLLGALDDKIELNRRMAETLETMARALFRSWFVDFDPVRAKAEGRPTGLPDNLAALFPDRFGEDGMPAGWSKTPISKLAQFLNGLALQKYPVQDGEPSLPVIKIAELRSGPSARTDRAKLSVPPEYHVKDGDHLFSWSGSLTHCRWSHGPGALNQHLFKVTPETGVPTWLVYEAVEYHLPGFQAIASGKAVTMGHIQRHHLDEALIAMPPKSLVKALNAIMAPLYERSLSIAFQSRTLAALRDTLLPKLISGELRIADAEKRVAAVA